MPVLFDQPAKATKPKLKPGEGPLEADDHEGKRTTLFGELQDTGVINLFMAHWFDGSRFSRRRYYVDGRPYKRPHQSVWARIDATIAKVDSATDDKHELRIHSFEGLSTTELQQVNRALVLSHRWISKNVGAVDLNRHKKTHKKPVFVKDANWNADFNELPVRDLFEIRAMDLKRAVAAFACRRYVVEEVPHHHGTYVDLVMIYDLKNKKPVRLEVRRGGFFLE